MKHTFHFRILVLLVFAVPITAWAALGGNMASVQTDQVHMKATLMRAATLNPNYTVHQIQTPGGVTIKEFASPGGTVFAVAWQGPVMPDLQQVLGQYFASYVTAAKARRSGHNHLTISEPGLVVSSHGHMRAFSGIAYVPSLLPTGVSPEQLH